MRRSEPVGRPRRAGRRIDRAGPGGSARAPEAVAQKAGLKIDGMAIEDVPHSHAAAARAVELALKGEIEALMKGSLHTDELMDAVSERAAHETPHEPCFLMQTPAYPRLFLITDAAINIDPTLEEKVDIVQNAIDLAHAFGIAARASPSCRPSRRQPEDELHARRGGAVQDGGPRPDPGASSTGRWRSTTPSRLPPRAPRASSPGRRRRRHPGRARPRERQHAGQAARVPGRRGERRHRRRRAGAHRPHQPRRFARIAHRVVRGRAASPRDGRRRTAAGGGLPSSAARVGAGTAPRQPAAPALQT